MIFLRAEKRNALSRATSPGPWTSLVTWTSGSNDFGEKFVSRSVILHAPGHTSGWRYAPLAFPVLLLDSGCVNDLHGPRFSSSVIEIFFSYRSFARLAHGRRFG